MEIQATCPHCEVLQTVQWMGGSLLCPACAKPWLEFLTEKFVDQCAMCGAAHLYRIKDFNRKWGVALVALGVLFAYWTYGISLLVVTLLDWIIARRVKEVATCYKCHAIYRDTPLIEKVAPFDLELADYYKNLR